MPHQCIRCKTLYGDGAKELIQGCGCGGRFFFFTKGSVEDVREVTEGLTENDKQQIEKDVTDIIGPDFDQSKPVILDLESIKIAKPGKYEIDLVRLFKGKPVIYKLEDGKYIIDIATSFKLMRKDPED